MAEDLKQKQFDVLFSTLGELQKGLMSGTGQVAGFLLLVIGWLATSEKASLLLPTRRLERFVSAISLVAAFGFYVYGACMIFARSQKTFKMLIQLDLMPSQYYESNVLSCSELIVFIGGTLFLVCLLLVMLFH